jgi:hypothetical protein
MDFDELENKISQSGSELTELKAAVKQLQARVDRHGLVIQVLKDMLLSRGELREDEFLERLERAIGQKAAGKTCRKCGKAMSAKHNRCIYCGEERPPELVEGVNMRRRRMNRYSAGAGWPSAVDTNTSGSARFPKGATSSTHKVSSPDCSRIFVPAAISDL